MKYNFYLAIVNILLFSQLSLGETARRGEPPYPDSEEPGFENSSFLMEDQIPPAPVPVRIDDDGQYYYEPIDPKTDAIEYSRSRADYIDYPPLEEEIERNGAFSISFGAFGPLDLVNERNNLTFRDIYGDGSGPILFVGYEKPLTRSLGILSLKVSSGAYFSAAGKGRFADPNRPDFNTKREETFTFLMFPNMANLSYKFNFSDRQWFVPYVEGGAGYFTFAEIRDDGQKPKVGAAGVTTFAGGIQLLMDKVDLLAISNLRRDYGVEHVWFTAEYKAVIGLNKTFDFTSSIINAGFTVDF